MRAVYELARDWGLDIHAIVDSHRKDRHRDALDDAQAARMRAELISGSVSKPPFPHPAKLHQGTKDIGTYRNGAILTPHSRAALAKTFGSNRRPAWK